VPSRSISDRPSRDCPSHDDIELAPLRILEHLVEAGTPVAALGTADTRIVILLDDLPAPPFGDLASEHQQLDLDQTIPFAGADSLSAFGLLRSHQWQTVGVRETTQNVGSAVSWHCTNSARVRDTVARRDVM
jgi:hypothetical protein